MLRGRARASADVCAGPHCGGRAPRLGAAAEQGSSVSRRPRAGRGAKTAAGQGMKIAAGQGMKAAAGQGAARTWQRANLRQSRHTPRKRTHTHTKKACSRWQRQTCNGIRHIERAVRTANRRNLAPKRRGASRRAPPSRTGGGAVPGKRPRAASPRPPPAMGSWTPHGSRLARPARAPARSTRTGSGCDSPAREPSTRPHGHVSGVARARRGPRQGHRAEASRRARRAATLGPGRGVAAGLSRRQQRDIAPRAHRASGTRVLHGMHGT